MISLSARLTSGFGMTEGICLFDLASSFCLHNRPYALACCAQSKHRMQREAFKDG
jgi:hypothetical protein